MNVKEKDFYNVNIIPGTVVPILTRGVHKL